MAEVKVVEEKQEVVEQLNSGANLEPTFVKKFFISNILSRAFSYLFGWNYDKNEPVKLSATADGLLRVSATAVVNTHNYTFTGQASNDYEIALDFGRIVNSVDIFIFDNDAVIKRSSDGVTYDSEIRILGDTVYSFDCSTKSILIKNATPGATASYQIVGWY
jgi:hypothetical protein